jgi:hypothetical protein
MAPHARVAELVDAHDSKSCSARSGGSIPSTGTSLRSRSGAKAARRSFSEGGRCKLPRATAGKPALQISAKQRRLVGWVERSETHHPFRHGNAAEAMGFTSFYPSYALVDAHDSKSCSARSGGSIPSTGTSLRCFAATAGRPALQTSAKQRTARSGRRLLDGVAGDGHDRYRSRAERAVRPSPKSPQAQPPVPFPEMAAPCALADPSARQLTRMMQRVRASRHSTSHEGSAGFYRQFRVRD